MGKARRGAATLAAGALILLGAAAPAMAADGTWYVDQANGADSPGCGVDAGPGACATIGAALDQAAADDLLSIAPGTYLEALTIDSSITLEGPADAVLVSDGSGPAISAQGAGVEASVTGLTLSPDLDGLWYAVVADGGSTVELTAVSIEHQAGATGFGPAVRAQNNSSVVLSDGAVQAAGSVDAEGAPRAAVSASNGSDLTITRSIVAPTTAPADGQNFAGIMLGDVVAEPGVASTLTMTASTVAVGGVANVLIVQGSANIADTSIPAAVGSPAGGYGIGVINGSATVTGGEITGHPTAGIGSLGTLGAGVAAQVTVNGTTIADNGTEGESTTGGIVVQAGANGIAPAGSIEVTGATLTDNSTGIVTAIPATVTGSHVTGSGSGIIAQNADLTVTDTRLVGDGVSTDQSVAGLTSANAGEQPVGLTVTDTEISNYPIGLSTSAVRTIVSTSTVADNTVAGIHAQPGSVPETPDAGDMSIRDSQITGNGALAGVAFAAGVIIAGGEATLSGTTIADNVNGMVVSNGDVTLADSSVTGSGTDAPAEGVLDGFGIVAFDNSSNPDAEFTITGSEISGNRAGMELVRSTVVRNSTIADNTWYGINAQSQTPGTTTYLTLSASTMVGNGTEALPQEGVPPFGLGIDSGAQALVAGSVLAGTSDGSACYFGDSSAVLTDGGYNVVSDASCALTEDTSLADTDPLVGVLGDNGGSTQTVLPALDSPAVDLIPVGSTAPGTALQLCLEGSTDQRGEGFTRPQGQACDAGAVEVAPAPVQITTETLPDGIVGQAYTGLVEATGGAGEPYAWAVTEGALPDGLELDPATGEITGDPAEEGTFAFTVQVDGEASAAFSVTVLPELVIVTDMLPEGTVGEPYTATLEAAGGDGGPYTWGIDSGDLPDGLELNPETGEITGTPTAAQSSTFTVVVGDPVYKEFTIEVVPAEQEETPPPGETAPPEETPPPADTPDEPGDEAPVPDEGTEPEGPADAGDGELAVSGVGSPWGGLVFAGLALLMGGLLLVFRRAGRLDLDG